MGSSDADTLAQDDEKPQHTLELPAYWIGKTEVTNAQFRPFVEGDGYSNQAYWTEAGWAWRQENNRTKPRYWDDPQWNGETQPVVGVTWVEAVAYVRWLSAQTGMEFRLPTEAEWEKAARGTDGRIWPWGNAWAEGPANTSEAGLNTSTPVGQYPAGASPYGALDMAGNVREWCATVYGAYDATASVEPVDWAVGAKDLTWPGLFLATTGERGAARLLQSLHKAGWTPSELRWLLGDNIATTIPLDVGNILGVPEDRVPVKNCTRFGHAWVADLFVNLATLLEESPLQPADRVACCAVGQGEHWGILLLEA